MFLETRCVKMWSGRHSHVLLRVFGNTLFKNEVRWILSEIISFRNTKATGEHCGCKMGVIRVGRSGYMDRVGLVGKYSPRMG